MTAKRSAPKHLQNAKRVVFCGTFTAKGFRREIGGGELRITNEGAIQKFVDRVDQITFSGEYARSRSQMACDMIVASRDAKFGQPEAHLGFVAGWGGTFRLPRRVGLARAKELLFTGKVIDAQQACDYGLVDFCGDAPEVDSYLSATLESIRQGSAVAIAQTKTLVNDSFASTMQQRCLEETVASCLCLSSGDTKARIRAFYASRESKT